MERLKVGMRVQTKFAGLMSVKWIAATATSIAAAIQIRATSWPVLRSGQRLRASHADARPIELSPDHAIFINAVLKIPVKCLINHTSIASQMPREEQVTSIPCRTSTARMVMLAEGLTVESYLDTGDHRRFANTGAVTSLRPDFSARTWELEGCAELVAIRPHSAGCAPSAR